ncbi:hypothetical protein CLUG_01118 [Clavispora lusitaniae ATCC 42720]|uniref:Uncharacterized protein n=1 Tax=Clavispora lusitaniae (strain ATCC 42720) TaxID=306902 RepID=C4XYU5_CLAL4|nr:uncharacterized protein CLUG_01118 [Clavispora lusitaniae ATCC 42720]EEQ36994.1 hypothetical protein CLUG_01118 [Clavispora lusitaniae ATCC 42720]
MRASYWSYFCWLYCSWDNLSSALRCCASARFSGIFPYKYSRPSRVFCFSGMLMVSRETFLTVNLTGFFSPALGSTGSKVELSALDVCSDPEWTRSSFGCEYCDCSVRVECSVSSCVAFFACPFSAASAASKRCIDKLLMRFSVESILSAEPTEAVGDCTDSSCDTSTMTTCVVLLSDVMVCVVESLPLADVSGSVRVSVVIKKVSGKDSGYPEITEMKAIKKPQINKKLLVLCRA